MHHYPHDHHPPTKRRARPAVRLPRFAPALSAQLERVHDAEAGEQRVELIRLHTLLSAMFTAEEASPGDEPRLSSRRAARRDADHKRLLEQLGAILDGDSRPESAYALTLPLAALIEGLRYHESVEVAWAQESYNRDLGGSG
jgi:hypothetical protein